MKLNKKLQKLLIAAAISIVWADIVYCKSWPMFMGNESRTGYTYEQAGGTLTLKWDYDTFSESICSPVTKDGKVFFGNNSGAVYALDARTGQVIWQESIEGKVQSSMYAGDEDLYVFTRDGGMYSFDISDGDINWSKDKPGEFYSSPVLYDGYIYIGRGGVGYKDILCIDPSDGSVKYSYDTQQPVWSSPMIYENKVYAASNDGFLYKLNRQLEKIWTYDTEDGLFKLSSPAADKDNDYIYIAPANTLRRMYIIDDDSNLVGSPSDELNTGGTGVVTSAIGVDSDSVYAVMFSTIQCLYSLGKTNLNLNWSVELGTCAEGSESEEYSASPAISSGRIYACSESGYLFCVSTSGVVLSTYAVNGADYPVIASPAVSNGYVYVLSKSGRIYGYKASRVSCISYPDDDEVVKGTQITIEGSAESPDFQSYSLYYGTAADPSEWHFISSGTARVKDGVLGQWNISSFPDADYTLKLEAVSAAETALAVNYFSIDNPPEPPTSLDILARSIGEIQIDWIKSVDDGSGDNDVEGYNIFRRKKGKSFDYKDPYYTVDAGSVTFTDKDIKIGTKYYYIVRSYDENNDSADSVSVSTIAYKQTVRIDAGRGGTAELADGTGVYFPPGALKTDSEIAITVLTSKRIPDAGVGEGENWRKLSKAWEFEIKPDRPFNKDATIKLAYARDDVKGLDEDMLRVYWYDDDADVWRMLDSSEVRPGDNRVQADIPHFSTYRVAQYVEPDYIINKDSTYVYPNPASGDEVTFKFKLMKAADIDLKVFNVAGELIEEFSRDYRQQDAGKTQEIKWDIQGVASGVYIWRIKGKADGREDEVIKKLAIIK